MKQTLVILCLVVFMIPLVPEQASGQIFKRLFQRDKTETDTQAEPRVTPKPESGKQSVTPASAKKPRYRIDVLVPLYMDELVKGNATTFRHKVPAKALSGISFLEGVKLAAEMADKDAYQVDVYFHDITGVSVSQLIQKKQLSNSDLLIGMVTSNDVTQLAAFAQSNKINFISVLSPSDGGVSNNPFFTLLQPTLRTHCERIKASVKKRHSRNKVFVYRRFNQEVDETAFNLIMTGEEKRFGVIDCNQKPSVRHLQELFDSTETNVIIMPVFDTEYAGGLIDQLRSEFPDYRFEVFGMPTWGNRAFIKRNEELINIAFSYTTPFYFDKTTASGKMLSDRYSETFGGTPNEWVFRGYETFLWYAGLLEKFGVVFNSRVNDFNTAIFTEYNIKPARDGSKNFLYNENQHLYLYRYQAGSYVVEH